SVRWVRQLSFDWVIDLQCLARSGIFAWLANGGLTFGLDEPREGARIFYDVVARRPTFHTHAVDWDLQILPLLGLRSSDLFELLPIRPQLFDALRRKWPVNSRKGLVLHPGARGPNKRWSAESFALWARQVPRSFPETHIAVLGGPEAAARGATIAAS